jgi:hypothetical protein
MNRGYSRGHIAESMPLVDNQTISRCVRDVHRHIGTRISYQPQSSLRQESWKSHAPCRRPIALDGVDHQKQAGPQWCRAMGQALRAATY